MKVVYCKIKRMSAFALCAAFLVITCQNCSSPLFITSANLSSVSASMSGNGTGYEGKLTMFRRFIPSNPCTEADRNGQPLANQVIYYRSAQDVVMVRENCIDITPVRINPSSIVVVDDSHISFNSTSFEKFTPGAFDIAAAKCPTPLTPIASAQRTNLVLSAVDLLAAPPWETMPEITTSLAGSFAGIPSFAIARTTPSPLDWQRLTQWIILEPRKSYAFSFMVKSGSSSQVRLTAYQSNPSNVNAGGVWDLTNGALLDSWNTGGMTATSYASRPIPGGYFVTFYFTTTPTMSGLDIGMSSDTLNSGDSVFVTGVQLEDIRSFCSP